MIRTPPSSTRPDTLFPNTTLFLSLPCEEAHRLLLCIVDRRAWRQRIEIIVAEPLAVIAFGPGAVHRAIQPPEAAAPAVRIARDQQRAGIGESRTAIVGQRHPALHVHRPFGGVEQRDIVGGPAEIGGQIGQARSEEHTSELQSLMRISYAVFCL